jgi:hypothetical protein
MKRFVSIKETPNGCIHHVSPDHIVEFFFNGKYVEIHLDNGEYFITDLDEVSVSEIVNKSDS